MPEAFCILYSGAGSILYIIQRCRKHSVYYTAVPEACCILYSGAGSILYIIQRCRKHSVYYTAVPEAFCILYSGAGSILYIIQRCRKHSVYYTVVPEACCILYSGAGSILYILYSSAEKKVVYFFLVLRKSKVSKFCILMISGSGSILYISLITAVNPKALCLYIERVPETILYVVYNGYGSRFGILIQRCFRGIMYMQNSENSNCERHSVYFKRSVPEAFNCSIAYHRSAGMHSEYKTAVP